MYPQVGTTYMVSNGHGMNASGSILQYALALDVVCLDGAGTIQSL